MHTVLNANFIAIHTALYDTFYNNEDALAFILSHEMSHLILGHQEQTADLITKIQNAGYRFNSYSVTYKALMIKYMKEYRDMEYMADTEAISLIVRAGYSPMKALAALNTMDTYGEVKAFHGWYNTHPDTEKRIESYKENLTVLDPNWVEEGKSNIYNSEVLSVKKSSDRVSFVIDKAPTVDKFYQVEDVESRLKRLAYVSYLTLKRRSCFVFFFKFCSAFSLHFFKFCFLVFV